jgi:uncharacterized tellurite resistance protein B-like protein
MFVVGSLAMTLVAPPGFHDAAAHELLSILEVMYLVAQADGFFSQEERREFLETVTSLSEGKLGSVQLSQLVDSWVKRGAASDVDKCLQELASALPDELSRRIAYGLALQIADADGQYLEAEATMLRRISDAFGLEDAASDEIAASVRMSRGPRPPR